MPNVGGPATDPTGELERTIVLFDAGTTDSTLYGNDYLAGGAGDDMLFGQLGNDTIQGDGSIDLRSSPDALANGGLVGARRDPLTGLLLVNPSHGCPTASTAGCLGADGSDYIEGGGGSDVIFGGDGTEMGLGDPGDTGATPNSQDADMILGDNGDIYRLVGVNGQFLTFNYDNCRASSQHIIAPLGALLDYTPCGAEFLARPNPANR